MQPCPPSRQHHPRLTWTIEDDEYFQSAVNIVVALCYITEMKHRSKRSGDRGIVTGESQKVSY